MTLDFFDKENPQHIKDAAFLLADNFPHAFGDCAQEEAEECLQTGKIAVAAVENGRVIGFAGAMPHYDGNVWEVHPVVVDRAHQGQGVGSRLLAFLEKV